MHRSLLLRKGLPPRDPDSDDDSIASIREDEFTVTVAPSPMYRRVPSPVSQLKPVAENLEGSFDPETIPRPVDTALDGDDSSSYSSEDEFIVDIPENIDESVNETAAMGGVTTQVPEDVSPPVEDTVIQPQYKLIADLDINITEADVEPQVMKDTMSLRLNCDDFTVDVHQASARIDAVSPAVKVRNQLSSLECDVVEGVDVAPEELHAEESVDVNDSSRNLATDSPLSTPLQEQQGEQMSEVKQDVDDVEVPATVPTELECVEMTELATVDAMNTRPSRLDVLSVSSPQASIILQQSCEEPEEKKSEPMSKQQRRTTGHMYTIVQHNIQDVKKRMVCNQSCQTSPTKRDTAIQLQQQTDVSVAIDDNVLPSSTPSPRVMLNQITPVLVCSVGVSPMTPPHATPSLPYAPPVPTHPRENSGRWSIGSQSKSRHNTSTPPSTTSSQSRDNSSVTLPTLVPVTSPSTVTTSSTSIPQPTRMPSKLPLFRERSHRSVDSYGSGFESAADHEMDEIAANSQRQQQYKVNRPPVVSQSQSQSQSQPQPPRLLKDRVTALPAHIRVPSHTPSTTVPSRNQRKSLPTPFDDYEYDDVVQAIDAIVERYKACIHTVFQHYSQFKHESAGRAQTFETIVKNAALINKSAFMKCCKDFGIQGDLLSKSSIERNFTEAVAAVHSKHLDESEFGRCLSKCILEGMTSHRELDEKYPTLYDKLVGVYSKMGFNDRKELRAVMHSRGFGTAVPGVLAAAAVLVTSSDITKVNSARSNQHQQMKHGPPLSTSSAAKGYVRSDGRGPYAQHSMQGSPMLPHKPLAKPTRHSMVEYSGSNVVTADVPSPGSFLPKNYNYSRRGSAEARMRLISTPGCDLVDGVLKMNERLDPAYAAALLSQQL